MKREFQLFDRREFVDFLSKSAAILGLTGLAARSGAAEQKGANPFAYDLSRLQKTDPKLINYEEVGRWRCTRKEPRQIASGSIGLLYVCAGNYITVFSPEGVPGLEIALTDAACSVAAAEDGTIYAGLRDHIEVFDTKGERRATWAVSDRKSWLTSLAVGASDVFAADSGKRVVLRYDKSGKLVGRIGGKDATRNVPGFIVPSPYLQVAICSDGLLRVNNPGRHRIESYTFDGDFEGAWGNPTAAIEGFCGCCNPIAIGLLSDGRFVTGEKGLPRVKIYNSTGTFESVVSGAESFPENARACSGLNDCAHGGLALAVDSRGRIFILDLVTSEVRVMQRKS